MILSSRDQLAELISDAYGGLPGDGGADAILAARWRPPARVITEGAHEALDQLPYESVVIDADGDAWQRYFACWHLAGAAVHRDSRTLLETLGPLTLVYVPTERGDRDE